MPVKKRYSTWIEQKCGQVYKLPISIIISSVDRTQHRVQRKERREGGGMGVALGKVPHLQIPRRRLHKKFREKEMYFLPTWKETTPTSRDAGELATTIIKSATVWRTNNRAILPLYGRTFHETHGANSLIITCDILDTTMACFIATKLSRMHPKRPRQSPRGGTPEDSQIRTGHVTKGFLYHFRPHLDCFSFQDRIF